MRKVFKLKELDCAVCAQKMEDAIKKVDGVKDCRVSYIAQRMIIDFEEKADVKQVLTNIVKVCKKVEPDCTLEM